MSVILRCTNDEGIVQDIQVQDQTDLRLDISAIENTTIGDVFGISSQDFSLVGSDGVNAFFGNVWNLGASANVALQNSIDCQVLLDGAEVFKGKLYIKNIITDSEGYNVIYNVIVVNETVDFKFEIQDLYLNQLNLSQYDHNFTYANISASWNGGLLGGDIVYPFVNYGRPEGDNDSPDYAFSSFNVTGSNSFDNFDSPLRLTDFKPSIRAKSVVDAIFSGSSYDYTSSFLNSEYFGDLFLLTTANDQLGPNNTSPVSQSAWVYNASGSQTLAANSQALVEFDAEVIDNANNFNLATERYTADTTGNYQYQISINYTIGNYAPSTTDRVTIILRKNGGSIVDSQQYFNPPATGSAFLQNGIQLEPSDYLEVEISFNSNTGTRFLTILNDQGQPSYYPQGYVSYFQVKGPASLLGGTIEMAEQFPDDLKALDFLQGLIEKFNLVVEPVPSSRNLISIEPYQTWIDSGKQIDWTNKIDRDVNFEIVHPILEQPRTIVFKDEDDTDVLNKYTLDNLGKTFGSYKFVSDSDLAEGERVVGKVFAATPVTGIPNGRTFVVPHLCTATDNREFRPLKFKPRLLYNNGVQNVPDTAFGISASVSTRGQIYIRDENSDTQTSTTWNQMSTLTAIPVNYSTGQDLHFNNDQYSQYFQASANGKVKADAFRTYWATYINSLYDIDARKLTCNVYLKPTEIQDIALNDKIFIDGAYYRINKINGANLSRRDTVEVELIKIIAQQLKFPRRRVGTTNLVLDYNSLSITGTGLYVDLDTGAVVNNFDTIRAVAAKDYMQIYNNAGTASVVWDYQVEIDNTNQFDQSVLGTNKVDIGASKVSALGSGNQVKAGTETSFIVGNQNFVGENTTNVTIFGQNHSVDDQAQNAQIIGGAFNSISGSNQSTIMGSSGSTIVNSDSSISINGTNDTILQSDFTTAINNHENEVIVNGSGHAVIGLNREGAGLDLLNSRNNSNFLGDTYIGGGYLIDSFVLDVGDGTNYYLTGSDYGDGKHETLYLLNWNGLSPGTASIHLPSATNSDYKKVVYTFKLTSGNSGEIVNIIPFDPAQTIDGFTSYATTGSYAFLSIHASNNKWHIIDNSTGPPGPAGPSGSGICAEEVKVINSDQPGPGEIYYYTSVQNTASVCQDLNTLDTFGLHYESTANRHFLDTGLTVTGSVIASSFTGSLLGTASFAISASFAPNVYNSDGFLTGNRNITLDGNNLTFLADGGESFIIASDPGSDVSITGLPQISQSQVVGYNLSTGQLTAMNTSSFSGPPGPPGPSGSVNAVNYDYDTQTLDVANQKTIFGSTCEGLPVTSIINTGSLTAIGGNAFSKTAGTFEGGLSGSYDFPNVKVIGASAFTNNNQLNSFIAPSCSLFNGTNIFSSCTSLVLASFPNITSIPGTTFQNCTSLVTASFPNATSIGNSSFITCTSLISASFPNVTTFNLTETTTLTNTFQNCTSLQSVSFPNLSGSRIGSSMFAGCSSMSSSAYNFGNFTGEIRGSSFAGNTSITNTDFVSGSLGIGSGSALTNTFSGSTSLVSASFPNALIVGNNTFQGCTSLGFVNLSSLSGSSPLGSTTGNNSVFLNTALSGSITVPSFLSSSNAGGVEGDVAYLIGRGWTVNYV